MEKNLASRILKWRNDMKERNMTLARKLKPGDKVNGYNIGWITVKFIENRFPVRVLYDTSFGNMWKTYLPDELVETLN